MNDQPQSGASVEQAVPASRLRRVALTGTALVGLIALLDAAVETFRSASPVRWWVAPPVVAFVALNAWAWRPGGSLRRRFGAGGAATDAIGGLLALFVATAWLPDGQTAGVRMLQQPTSTLLAVLTALAVVFAGSLLVRAAAGLPRKAAVGAAAVVVSLTTYATYALALAAYERAPYAALFHGAAAWQRLPAWLQGPMIGVGLLIPLAVAAHVVMAVRDAGIRGIRRWASCQPVALALVIAIGLSTLIRPDRPGAVEHASEASVVTADEPFVKDVPADTLNRLFVALEALSAEIPRGTFEPQAVVEKVGRDPGKLFEWVRDETLWVPYLGELRGPTGVLMDRVGNSLDRSLLLAELLQKAGHTVRLARASLTEQQAGELLSRVRPASKDGLPAPNEPLSEEAAKRLEKVSADLVLPDQSVNAAMDQIRREREQGRARATEGLSKVTPLVLAAAGMDKVSEDPAGRRSAIRCIRDHWWVQVQTTEDAWADADPLTASARMGETFAQATETLAPDPADQRFPLDPDMVHRVTVRVVVEQLTPRKLTEHVVLAHELRPCDNVGQDARLRHVPIGWPKGVDAANQADLKKALLAQAQWMPVLEAGGKTVSQSGFTVSGDIVSAPRANSGGPVPAPAGGMLGGLGGMLGGGGNEEDKPAAPTRSAGLLTAEWVDFELSRPGERSRTIRREVFDLLGPTARAAASPAPPGLDETRQLDRALALMGEARILALPCDLSPQFLLHQVFQPLVDAKDKLLTIALTDEPGRRKQLAREALDAPYALGMTHWWALARQRLSPVHKLVYLDSLNVLTHTTEWRQDANGSLGVRERIDIAANPIAVVQTAAENPLTVRVRQGLADTAAEGLVLDRGSKEPITTITVLTRTAASQIPLHVLRPGQPDPGQAGMTPDIRARVDQDLAAGYLVVLPATPILLNDSLRCGWFRVHMATGETLGVMDNGFHQANSDYSLQQSKVTGLTETAAPKPIPEAWTKPTLDYLDEVNRLLYPVGAGALILLTLHRFGVW
jgi:hypothetical protein